MQYKIPQNVQIEDKIVGPLTLKQLIVFGTGGGFTYAVYTILASKYYWEVWLIPTVISSLLTLAFTLLKVGGIPFGKWCLLTLEYLIKPKKRLFVMGSADNYQNSLFAEKKKTVQTKEDPQSKAERDRIRLQKIGALSKTLDSYNQVPHST